MKRIFLAFAMLSAFAGAQAFEYEYPTLTDKNTYVGKYSPIATPVAIGADGTIYQTGLYDDMVMIGDDILEPVATSAFLGAIDPATSKSKWTVGIQGAAHITAITTTSDAIYVAGTFADDITLGSKDFNTKSYTGSELTHDQDNGFVAKYSLTGNLLASQAIIPHKNANYDEYESDLMVYPTAIVTFNNKVYVSMTYLGGYSVGSLKKDGNVKNSFGYWDSKCAGVISFATADLSNPECIYDIRNAEEINENGYAPNSISLTADAEKLYIGVCTSESTKETINESVARTYTRESGDLSTYMINIHAIDKEFKDKICSYYVASDRAYTNNVIKNMIVADGNIYMSGCVSTPLFFAPGEVPDLWTDQFAACLSTSDFAVKWANITGAKRDDMKTMNEKYRECTGAALCEGKYYVIGSTNFVCDATGTTSNYSPDYCLGIASNNKTIALTTKTDAGSKVAVTSPSATGIVKVIDEVDAHNAIFDLSGRKLQNEPKGSIYIKGGKKMISK